MIPLNSIQPIPPGIKRGKLQLGVEALTRLAREMGPGAKLPTARELSKALGVTGATLTRCLERLEGQGILRCRQGIGIYVDAGVMQKRVGLVFGENIFSPAASQFGSLMLKHCAQRAAERNERFSFYIDTLASNGVMNGGEVPAHQDLVDALKDDKLDGIILMSSASAEQEAWLRNQRIPVVSTDYREGSNGPCVQFDYQKLIHLGVERLVRTGCKTVGILGALAAHQEMFEKALKEFGLPYKPEWAICRTAADVPFSESHEPFGRGSAERLLKRCGWGAKKTSHLPDGVLITDDMMARGALAVFSEQGVAIGKDLKVCSHANKGSIVLAKWESMISSVQFDPEDIASGLFEILEALLKGTPQDFPYLIHPVVGG
jgi:DNA-binding LacI/PurR family transcriptional regulator